MLAYTARQVGPRLCFTPTGVCRIGPLLLTCAILYGCGDGDGQPPAPRTPAPPPAAALPDPAPAGSVVSVDVTTPLWAASRAPDAFSLTLTDQARGPAIVLRMTCRPDRSFTVESQLLTQIGSEERLTLGVGATVIALVATAMPDGEGVQASGQIDTGLLGNIAVGHGISVSYGAQSLGPLRSAARPLLARFVLACRNYSSR